MKKPKRLNIVDIDFTTVFSKCELYLNDLDNGVVCEDQHDDYEYYICQAVMRALYGEEVFNFINSTID